MDKLSHLTAADIDRALTEKDLRGMVPEEGLGATLYVAALRAAWLLRLALQEGRRCSDWWSPCWP